MLLTAKTVLFRTKSLVACRELRASQAAISAWKPLCARKSPRGDPRAGVAKRSILRASKFMRMSMTKRRTAAFIAESAMKELQSLAEFMPNLADTDARTLALRLIVLLRIGGWHISRSCSEQS